MNIKAVLGKRTPLKLARNPGAGPEDAVAICKRLALLPVFTPPSIGNRSQLAWDGRLRSLPLNCPVRFIITSKKVFGYVLTFVSMFVAALGYLRA